MRGVKLPVGVSAFAEEIYQAPKSWSEKAYVKLIHYNKIPQRHPLRRLGAAGDLRVRNARNLQIAPLIDVKLTWRASSIAAISGTRMLTMFSKTWTRLARQQFPGLQDPRRIDSYFLGLRVGRESGPGEAEISRLYAEEDAIRDEMTELPAFSLAALKAKLAALQDDCEHPELNDAILRDLTLMTNA